MSKNKKPPEDVERFITFLSDDDSLESSQNDIKEFSAKLSILLKDANSTLNALKLKKASDERKAFLDKQKSKVSSFMGAFKTRAEMAKALLDGSLEANGQRAVLDKLKNSWRGM